MVHHMPIKGSGIVFGFVFPVLGFFLSAVLSVFLAICSILELEAAISTFWSSNLSFSMIFATIWAQTIHVGRYFATRGHLGFV